MFDLNFRSAIAMEVKFIFYDVLKFYQSLTYSIDLKISLSFCRFFLLTVAENIFANLFYWKEIIRLNAPPEKTDNGLYAKGLRIFCHHGWQNINRKPMFC